MITVILRTLFIYFSLILFMKLMGKRQVGELEISELVSTLLLSEIVSMPIENSDIPLSAALIPMLIIISLEIMLSFAITKSDVLKRLLGGKPSVLISRGKLNMNELEKTRMSVEELLSELRLKGIGSLGEVNYAMLEQNGQISVILNKNDSPLTPRDMDIKKQEQGISHPIIVDGHVKEAALASAEKSTDWLCNYLSQNKIDVSDVFLMTLDDADSIKIIYKNGNSRG